MSVDDEKQKGKLNAQMNDWLTHLFVGWVGKIFAVIAIPVIGYLFGTMMSSAEKTRQSIAETNRRLDVMAQQLQTLQYRQQEMIRHMRVIETKVLGYTMFDQGREDYTSPSTTSPVPMMPAPTAPPLPPQEPKPGGDKGAMIDPADRRKSFARLPLLVRSAHQRR